jgi:hypothetical protein
MPQILLTGQLKESRHIEFCVFILIVHSSMGGGLELVRLKDGPLGRKLHHCQKIRQTPPVCSISVGCPCTTDDPDLQFADFSTKTNSDIYDVQYIFADFFISASGILARRGEINRNIYDSSFPMLAPDRISNCR